MGVPVLITSSVNLVREWQQWWKTAQVETWGGIWQRGNWTIDERATSQAADSKLDFRESDGCLVAPAVFKTVVGPFAGPGYVRFVPSPPSRSQNGVRSPVPRLCRQPLSAIFIGSLCRPVFVSSLCRNGISTPTKLGQRLPTKGLPRMGAPWRGKEVVHVSREQILKLTSLSSCAG